MGLAAGVCVAVAVVFTVLWASSERFAYRVENAVGAFTGATPLEGDSIGHRGWIWRGAGNMIEDNALNGVGAGGFRYAFPDYVADGDPYYYGDPPINPSHSHQLWLEMLSETGMVGALGLLALLALLVMAAVRAPPGARRIMLPYGLCLLAAYFPFNTHMSIYSSFWSQIVWWLIALYCAAYGAGREPWIQPRTVGPSRSTSSTAPRSTRVAPRVQLRAGTRRLRASRTPSTA